MTRPARPKGLKNGERIGLCEHFGPTNEPQMFNIAESPEPFVKSTDRGMLTMTHFALCDACKKKAWEEDSCSRFITRHARYEGEDYVPTSWRVGKQTKEEGAAQ